MKKLTKKFRARLGAGLLAGVMLFGSLPLTAMAASGQDDLLHGSIKASAIQLETAPTKMMDYYAAADEPAGIQWVTDADAVSFLPAAATEGDVTCAVKATDGAVWIGTQNGLMRMDLTEKDSRDMVQYFAGNRYMYNGNDNVTGLAADDAGGVWVKNADGCVHIKMVDMTMEERTYFYEKLTNDINDRRGMISSNNGYSYDPTTDEYTQSFVSTSDNDGLWTAMYAMGEILRYQTLKQENADAHEIAAAKKAATRATKAVLLLDYISGRGNGFPCRSYMLTSEAGAQEGANGMQAENGFWFEKRLLNENESYFYRSPLVRNQAMFARGDRQDVFYIEAGNRDKKAQTNYALPLDEMEIGKDNGNPFVRYTGYGQQNTAPYTAASLCDCTVFTLPYWLGRYYGIIKETEGTYFTRVTPTVTLTADGTTLTATVKDGATALNRVIVDFYADGAYIGRVRTDATGKAVFDGSEKLSGGETVTAQTTERLIGTTMYNQTDSNEAAIPDPNKPASIALSVPENCEMVVGDSRSIDFVILPESNKLRAVTWTSSDENVATVDEWGRVTAKAAGTVTITATAKANTAVKDSGTIKVVATLNDLAKTTGKAVVNYEGAAAEEVQNLQKYVDRYTKDEALAAEDTVVPATVKAVLNGGAGSTTAVTEGTATWSLETYGIKRVDTNPAHERDAEQLFMGNRYLPADAAATPNTSVIHMESDNANGLWVASATAVTHIRMEELSYTDKAAEMSETTQENVARRGMVAQSIKNGTAWAPEETDNDGLWTSMYGVGELMRYAVLKEDDSATTEEVAAAKETALSSIKAVLLLSNLTCRTGTVDAYVRPLKNESNQYAFETQFEGIALKKDNQNGFSINNPQSGPVDKTARVDGPELMAPFFPEDWAPVTATSNKADFATRKRTLEGMIARTYRLDGEYPGRDYNDGYYWDIDGDTATCVESTSTKVKWEKLVGQTVDASGEIPEVLADLLGNGITKDNITYKTDTSTDEIIGHLFIYKVAYDILDDNDQEEAAIKEVLVDTVRNIAQHLADNGYCLRDATGQATTWGKTERDYFNNAYAWEDCALNSLVNLCAFKLAGYVTGEARWENEYRMLALDDPYRYADLAGEYWTRWEHLADVDEGLTDPEEVYTWILQNLNYSDEEMAMEAYYLLFQMEDDAELIGKYQDGLNAWWNSMQYSENPLWYYIYQLAYPEAAQQDAYENDLVDTAAWALSRHPIDTIKWSASHADRPDVKQDEELTRDKTTGEIRVVPFDERSVHKYNGSSYKLTDDNINRMEGSTTYTLPYWMGRYHGMITPPTTTP